jgi:hypothetical protein
MQRRSGAIVFARIDFPANVVAYCATLGGGMV